MLDSTEKAYFDSLSSEKINPIRERHDVELRKINSPSNVGRSLAPYTNEVRRYKREIAEARIQAYIETYRKVGRYPDESEFQEFGKELYIIVDNKGNNLPRHLKGPLSPFPIQLVEKVEEQVSREIRQDAALALSSLHHFINEGKLAESQATKHYDKAKDLYQNTKPLDPDTAKLLIELADDAIKEFGNTNQEKKVELREIKEKAEEVLPPKTVEELRKRAEGKAIEKVYPQSKRIRNALYVVIVFIVVASGLLWLRKTFSGQSEVTKIASPTATPELLSSPSPIPTPSGNSSLPSVNYLSNTEGNYKGINISVVKGIIADDKVLIRLKVVSTRDTYVLVSLHAPQRVVSYLRDDNGKLFEATLVRLTAVKSNYNSEKDFISGPLKAMVPEYIEIGFCNYRGTTQIESLFFSISDSSNVYSPAVYLEFKKISLTFSPEIPIACEP